jgi:hypothetical protein
MLFVSTAGRVLTVCASLAWAGKTARGQRRQVGMTCHADPGVHHAELLSWRRRQLVAAGLPDHLAAALASTPGVDLHALLQLIDRGCPAELAARIIAPIDRAGTAS